jgi:hypothetical protein
VAFDFFTVPTLTFQLLYCFFLIEHGRRRILHFNITRHPTARVGGATTAGSVSRDGPYRYAIFDHDSKFDAEVTAFLRATGLRPKHRVFRHRGKTVLRNAGWEAAAARFSTISLR